VLQGHEVGEAGQVNTYERCAKHLADISSMNESEVSKAMRSVIKAISPCPALVGELGFNSF
jgi:hypothetical protein